ncbi:CopM family metallochaperone [Pararhizobium sp. PWRC1-1]|uniref:CopM family metallochaperone n=1 Tax=Pararhizobium sp. PWRC1-1 TaxID=2804566 RepID=UPI003CF5FD93
MNKLTPIFIASSLVISAGLAVAQSQMKKDNATQGHDVTGMEMSDKEMPTSDTPSIKAYLAVNDRMHKDMTVEFTGDADIDFMRGMIPHHQGAIDMAKVVLEYGKDLQVRKLAEEVIKAQEGEIAMMKTWLAARGQ